MCQEIVDTSRHCKKGLRACNNIPQPQKIRFRDRIVDDCCMLTTLPCGASCIYGFGNGVIPTLDFILVSLVILNI